LNDINRAYASFLQQQSWDYFATVTFRTERKDPYIAVQRVIETSGNPSRGFYAVEPHSTGALHVHAILAYDDMSPRVKEFMPYTLWSDYFKRFGRSKVERVREQSDVSNYCAKYVTKRGFHYEFSGNNWTLS